MNHIYRVVWNDSKRVWQAVTELGRAKGKSSGGTVDHRQQSSLGDSGFNTPKSTGQPSRLRLQICGAWAVALGSSLLASATAADLPTGGQVVAGSGSISQSGAAMTITQGSNNMVVNWDSFSVGAGNSVNFVQPGAQAAALNRVLGSDVSVIQGAINANGRIFLVNPNGVLFSPTAQVNVGSLVASTLNISTEDFMRGNYRFEGTSSNAIINQGNIKAVGDGNGAGTIALIAAKITNLGTLTANKGNVLMGAGHKVRLDLGGPVKLEVEQAAVDALIEQGGAIKADGGLVYLTAKAAGNLAATVINHTGITEAQTLQTGENGQIYLLGDMQNDRINVGGTLDASAPKGGDGGFIETSAAKVVAVEGRKVTTKAPKGKTGTYLIDPNDFTIAASGGNITGTQLSADLDGTSVTISTAVQGTAGGNGDIFVNDAVSWNAASKLTLNAERNISINADITAQNANGQVALHYGQGSDAAGNTATYTITSGAKVNLQAGQNFSTKLGEDGSEVNWTVITSLGSQGSTTGTDLQGINGNLSGRFVLGADIDAKTTSSWNSGAGFVPLGNSTTKFTGSFDGLGHTINGLYINRATNYNGLFGYVDNPSTTISNVGVTAASVSGLDRNGILAGWIVNGKVVNSYSTGSVAGRYQVGGLVGFVGTAASFSTGSIISSYSLASVYGSYSSSVDLGGLVGLNFDFAITDSFATGAVNASSSSSNHTGGLVGRMGGQASIADSFASGSVSGYNVVGGLVGYNYSSGTISRTYASGQVTGIYEVGGLIGTSTGLVSSSYWNINTTGQTVSAGGVGISNTEMSAPTSFADWNISSSGTDNTKWRIYEGLSAPLLRRFLTKVSINGELAEIPATKVYDGLSALDESLANVTWVKNGSAFVPDSALLSGNLFELSGKNVGVQTLKQGYYSSSPIGYDITYNITGQAQTITITPKALSITGTSVADKTYDGTTDATATTGTLSGLVGDETLDVSVASALFANKNAGEQTATVAYTLADGSYGENQTALASNYTLDTTTHTATINQKALSITSTSVADKTYDGSTEASATVGSLSGLVGDETLDVSVASALFASKNAGEQTATVAYTLADGSYGENQTALASNYMLDTTTHTATINQKALVINGTSVADKVYDGTIDATATIGTLSGFVGEETISLDQVTAQFASKNVGENYGIVSYTLADGENGGLASNYSLVNTVDTNAAIIAKALSINGTSVADRTYDGTTDATATAGTLSGLVGDETLDVSVASALFASKNAGEQTATVAYTLADGSYGENQTALASNYTLGETTHAATINQKALAINGTSVADKTYDGTTDATATAGTLSGLVGDETLDVSVASALFAGKNAGEQTATVAYTLADGSYGENQTALASNYTLGETTHTATINQKALAINGTSVADKTYDGTTDATATAGTLSGLVGDETLDVSVASALFAGKNAGEQTATVAYTLADGSYGENQTALASNYTLGETTHTATINQKALSITGTSVADKTYDGTTEATATAGTLSGLVGDETLDVSVASALFAGKNAGEQTATVAYTLADGSYGENQTALASNYSLGKTTHTATINQKALAINGTSVADKTYDGTTDATATAGTLSGLVGDETLDVSVASALFAGKNAGEQTATVAYTLADGSYGENQTALASNYTLGETTHAATINQKALAINGTSVADKTYDGTTDATATAGTLSGLVGDETLDVSVASALFAGKNAGEQTATVAYTLADGSYGENQTALASNYTLDTTTHTATINQKALSITGTSVADKTYDGTTEATATAGSLSGLVGDETLDVSVASALFASKNAGEQTATVAYTLADGSYGENQTALASNYTLDTTTHTATITPRTLTITGSSVADKVYDGTTNADITSGQLNNLVAGETLELAASGAFGNRNAGTYAVNINYTLNDGVNGLASNYSVSPMTTVSAQITPRPITVSADDKTKIHLQPDPALTWSLTEGRLIAGDSLNIPLSRNAGETVGIYPIFAQSIDNPNYQVSTLPGRFTIVMSQTPSNDIIIPQRAAISSANSNASGTGQSNGNGLTAAGGNPPNFAGNSMAPQQTGTSGGAGNSNSGNSLASGGLIFVPVEAGSSPASTPGLQPILVVSSGVNLPTESIDTGFNSSAISGAGAGGGLIP